LRINNLTDDALINSGIELDSIAEFHIDHSKLIGFSAIKKALSDSLTRISF
jgi:hypothetical protein